MKLSSDEKFLVFDNHNEEEGEVISPVDLNRISNVKALEQGGQDSFTLAVREAGSSG